MQVVKDGLVPSEKLDWMWGGSKIVSTKDISKVTKLSHLPKKSKQKSKDEEFFAIFDRYFEETIDNEVMSAIDRFEAVREQLAIEVKFLKASSEGYFTGKHLNSSLRIGVKASKKKYVIKDLDKFFYDYENGGVLEISASNRIKIERELFDEQTQKIIDLLNTELSYNLYRKSKERWQLSAKDDKFIALSKGNIREILTEISKIQFLKIEFEQTHYYDDADTIEDLKLSNELIYPAEFYLTPNDGEYHLEMEAFDGIEWQYYEWILRSGTAYRYHNRDPRLLLAVRSMFEHLPKQTQVIQKENMNHFMAKTLPLLQKVGRVHLPNDEEHEFIKEPLEAKVQFDIDDMGLVAEVFAKYGDYTLPNDFKKIPENTFIIQDTIGEVYLGKELYKIGFEQNRNGQRIGRFMPQGIDLYHFFKNDLAKISKIATVELSDELAKMFVTAAEYKPQIKVEENGSWLDVTFNMDGISEDEVVEVLRSVLANEKYHEFRDGRMLSLESDEFYETSKALQAVRGEMDKKVSSTTVQLSRNKGLMLANELEGKVETEFSEGFKKMIADLANPMSFEVEVPKLGEATMREYQVEGLKWLSMLQEYQFGGVLADEMGLGKTIQAISFICNQRINNPKLLVLIVVPASLTYNWKKELEKFAPELNALIMVGTVMEREQLFAVATKQDVLITSYATLRQDEKHYKKLPIDMMFLDEAQYIKNSQTQTTKALKELKIPNRFALTGTPMENSIDELWAIFQMVLPGLFPSKPKFKKMDRDLIAKTIQPFILRREKEQVLKDLPDKIENISYSEFDVAQKKVYLAYLKRMQEDVAQMTDEELKKNKITILSMITKLRQICDDPRLIIDNYEDGSAKLEQLKEMLVSAKENGRRVLVFSQFTSMLEIIQTEIKELGLSNYYLHGGTKARERLEMVDKFNEGKKDVFLISLKAGGTGLNLTGADTVILYDLWWNPAVEEQATSRAHRMGQKKVVEVYRMIVEGTIEEKIYALQQSKKDLFNSLVKNTDETAALSEDDIRNILSVGVEKN
jgi:hypothetical protein